MKAARYPARSLPAADSEGQSSWAYSASASEKAYMSADGSSQAATRLNTKLDAHVDARELVRLIQCSQCSLPFKVPVTLPCGHSVCRSCLPPPHRREHISYPNNPDRLSGITCPVEDCGLEHPAADCNIDVCLSKVMESIQAVVEPALHAENDESLRMEELRDTSSSSEDAGDSGDGHRKEIRSGGRLLAAFDMAGKGRLDYNAELVFEELNDNAHDHRALDAALLERLRETTNKELDCQVCYNLMHDPVTAPCGHTYCRICLARVLDHSVHCPACRRSLPIPPSLARQASNHTLVALLKALCPDMVAARAAAIAADELGGAGELDTPLFVCTLGFPHMPTFLHIFEPRYRLMIRRAVETNRQFGMMMYNQSGQNQGDLGAVNFKEYGTMLQILNVHMFPDGRSLVETKGMYRFRVLEHGTRDGYTVGRIERLEDVSLVEEERMEAEEISRSRPARQDSSDGLAGHPDLATNNVSASPDRSADVNTLTTHQLLRIGLDFVEKMQAHSAPWLHHRILQSHGGPPDDANFFPYWFAAVIPIIDEEKYQLLRTSTVRERMKIVVGWIRRIENQRWLMLNTMMGRVNQQLERIHPHVRHTLAFACILLAIWIASTL